jgi:hypothetical protein
MGSPASHGVPQPPQGWQLCHGIGGSFAVESVAAFAWNRWQACYGISGSFRVERVAALPWNTQPRPHFRQSWLFGGLLKASQRRKSGMWHRMTAILY